LALLALGLGWPDDASAQLLEQYFPRGSLGYGQAVLPDVRLRPEDLDVLARPRRDYDPLGMRLGGFRLNAGAGTGLGYDSNPLGATSQRGAWIAETQANLSVASDWSRHALGLSLNVDDWRYFGQGKNDPDQSHTNWNGALTGALDIGRDRLSAALTHSTQYLLPTSVTVVGLRTPRQVDVDELRLAYRADFGRLSLTPTAVVQDYRYGSAEGAVPGATVPSRFLDHTLYDIGVTGRFALTPERDIVAVLRGTKSQYGDVQPGSPARDSDTLTLLAGLDDRSLGGVLRYRVLVGVQYRTFKASSLASRTTPAVEAAVTWSPTRLTSIGALVSRRMEDATSEGIFGLVLTQGQVSVDHELMRNVLIGASFDYLRAEAQQGGGQSTLYGPSLRANWLLNRNVRLGFNYSFIVGTGDALPEYNRNLLMLRLSFAL